MSSELREPTGVLTETQVRAREKAGKTKLVIGAIAALLVIGAGVGYFLLRGKGRRPRRHRRHSCPAAQPDRAALQQQAAAQLAEAQRIEQQYKELLEKQSKDMQARYDEQLASMRKEMDTAKQRAQQAQQAADAPAPPPSRPAPPATVASQPVRPAATQAPRRRRRARHRAPAATTAAARAGTRAAGAGAGGAAHGRRRRPGGAQRLHAAEAAGAAATPPTRPSPSACARRRRWWCGCWSTSAAAWHRPSSRASQKGFGFDQSALQAAKGARFAAATQGGQPVKRWVDLPIHFKL